MIETGVYTQMNIEQLKAFCTVARTLSFTEAAKILTISQPAVSRQIAVLEDEIGSKLFKREHNTLTLTRAGDLLYGELPQKLSELEKVFFEARLVDQGKIRRIKIGVLRDQYPDAYFLNVCRSMRRENYYVRVQQYDFLELENAVLQKDIDLAVSIRWVEGAFTGMKQKIYGQEMLCLAVNKDFSPELPIEMNRESLEVFSKDCPAMILKTECYPKVQFREIAEITSKLWAGITEEDPDVVIPMVQTGIGSAVVNESHILSSDPSVLMLPIDFLLPLEKGIFWLETNPNEAVRDFVRRMDTPSELLQK